MRIALTIAALFLGGGVVFAVGFVVGRSEGTKSSVGAAAKKRSLEGSLNQTPDPVLLPDAREAMRKAALLKEQNPDAYDVTYLNKRYRVTGEIGTVIGTVHRDLYSGPAFGIVLENWGIRNSKYPMISAPHLELIDVPRGTQLAIRPGQHVDADCLLEEWMDFRYCRLNRPIGS